MVGHNAKRTVVLIFVFCFINAAGIHFYPDRLFNLYVYH
jgi:hypothetical protein